MKKLILLALLLLSSVCFSQVEEKGKEELYTIVYHPTTKEEIMLSKRQKLFLYQLDSLSKVYNQKVFIINTLFKDGRVEESFVRKVIRKPLPKKSTIKKTYNRM